MWIHVCNININRYSKIINQSTIDFDHIVAIFILHICYYLFVTNEDKLHSY